MKPALRAKIKALMEELEHSTPESLGITKEEYDRMCDEAINWYCDAEEEALERGEINIEMVTDKKKKNPSHNVPAWQWLALAALGIFAYKHFQTSQMTTPGITAVTGVRG